MENGPGLEVVLRFPEGGVADARLMLDLPRGSIPLTLRLPGRVEGVPVFEVFQLEGADVDESARVYLYVETIPRQAISAE